MDGFLGFLVSLFGVALVAIVVYFLYKKILILIGGAIVLGLGTACYYFINEMNAPWPMAILVFGLMAGLLCIPCFLVQDIDELMNKVKNLTGESTELDDKVIAPLKEYAKKIVTTVDTENKKNEKAISNPESDFTNSKNDILEALHSDDETEKDWAIDMLKRYSRQGVKEAGKILYQYIKSKDNRA